LLVVVVLIAAGCGSASPAADNSSGANSNVALERADALLGKVQNAGAAARAELTPESFAAVTKAHGFTDAVAGVVAGRVQRGTLALGLDDVATKEIAYRNGLRRQAALFARLAPVFTALPAAVRAWEQQFKAGAFPNRKAANAEYRRRVDRPLERGLRLLANENLLEREAATAGGRCEARSPRWPSSCARIRAPARRPGI
jgi:hypothetical protein